MGKTKQRQKYLSNQSTNKQQKESPPIHTHPTKQLTNNKKLNSNWKKKLVIKCENKESLFVMLVQDSSAN